ncbi:MAG: 3-dehydroquinate synthase [Campylobacterales bacterium]
MNIKIDLGEDRSYNITIDSLPKIELNKKVAIITNPKVAGLHLETLLKKLRAKEIYIITVNDGEEYKKLSTIEHITDSALNHRLDRNSAFIALGGGVIGDMTGFVAGIYQRGVEFIQIPTTLLSMVDASVGGKTGVNTRFGKNLIGLFNQPSAVYIDTEFLSTLPKREFSAGVAEIIKMAVTFDEEFFGFLEKNSLYEEAVLKYAIKRCVELKAKVVSEDERERGSRALLNYGHTFGHVIENLTSYKTYLHGEAVSIGIVMANELSNKLGLMSENEAKRVFNLLQKYDLPTDFTVSSVEEFYDKFFLDKNSMDNNISFILPKKLGSATILSSVDRATIIKTLEQFT